MNTHVLPISELTKAVPRVNRAYPKELVTIGDHIRKRRLDLKLFQREVAAMLGVPSTRVSEFENGAKEIPKRLRPKIVKFLGYNPF